MEIAETIAIPLGILIALLMSGVSWVRQDKATALVKKVSEGQQQCQTCLGTIAIESTKQTTLLEQISQKLNK